MFKLFLKYKILKPVLSLILRRNRVFKDSYLDQEAYLLGDGVSIKYFDLKFFRDKPCIPISYIHFHNDAHLLNMCFSLINEPFYFYPFFRLPYPPYTYWRNVIQIMYRKFRKLRPRVPFFTNVSNLPFFYGSNNYYLFDDLPGSDFVDELKANGLKPFDGSVRTGIVLAHYFGFRKIYLVGFDYTHNPSVAHHFYEKGNGQIVDLGNHNSLFFNIANKYIECITITTNEKKSNYLESISYEKYTGCKTMFKENVDIVDMGILTVLDKWSDYKIF